MRITVLIDNNTRSDLAAEWGLSFLIDYEGVRFLLDTGASGLFAENAEALGFDLNTVQYGILSHAHYDHSDGMDTFFEKNGHALFYLQSSCGECCYDREEDGSYHYEGIKKGLLKKYDSRIRYVEGDTEFSPGVWLIPHKTPDLSAIGEKNRMYLDTPLGWIPDDFQHEQSLVFETEDGLVIFNSCSHAGADNIIKEVSATFPGKKVRAMLGGFHLFNTPAEEVRDFAKQVYDTGVECIVTGHCTGDAAYAILEEVLGARLYPFYSGFTLEL